MPYFSESQLEQAFVELFKKEGYDYVYGESISRDTRDVILYDDLRLYLRKKYEADHITEDEIKEMFIKAADELFSEKDEIIENTKTTQRQ